MRDEKHWPYWREAVKRQSRKRPCAQACVLRNSFSELGANWARIGLPCRCRGIWRCPERIAPGEFRFDRQASQSTFSRQQIENAEAAEWGRCTEQQASNLRVTLRARRRFLPLAGCQSLESPNRIAHLEWRSSTPRAASHLIAGRQSSCSPPPWTSPSCGTSSVGISILFAAPHGCQKIPKPQLSHTGRLQMWLQKRLHTAWMPKTARKGRGRIDALARESHTWWVTTLGERGSLPQTVVTIDLHAEHETRWGRGV